MEKKIEVKRKITIIYLFLFRPPARKKIINFKKFKNDDNCEMANRKEKYEYYTNANEE